MNFVLMYAIAGAFLLTGVALLVAALGLLVGGELLPACMLAAGAWAGVWLGCVMLSTTHDLERKHRRTM